MNFVICKKQTVAHIEEVADKFQASLEERGAKVFRAKDGDELKAQLLQICKENNIHRIVKFKIYGNRRNTFKSFF